MKKIKIKKLELNKKSISKINTEKIKGGFTNRCDSPLTRMGLSYCYCL